MVRSVVLYYDVHSQHKLAINFFCSAVYSYLAACASFVGFRPWTPLEAAALDWQRGSIIWLDWYLDAHKSDLFTPEGKVNDEHTALRFLRDSQRKAELRTLSRSGLLRKYLEASAADPALTAFLTQLGTEALSA